MCLSVFRQALKHTKPAPCRRAGFTTCARLMSDPPQDENAWSAVITGSPNRHSNPSYGSTEPYKNQKRTIEDLWKDASDRFMMQHKLPPHDAYVGRTVEFSNGEVARAAKMLDKVLSVNNVPREWFTNRRHRQKGEERRRLRSLRWRRRFEHEVGQKVQLVQQIRRRGA